MTHLLLRTSTPSARLMLLCNMAFPSVFLAIRAAYMPSKQGHAHLCPRGRARLRVASCGNHGMQSSTVIWCTCDQRKVASFRRAKCLLQFTLACWKMSAAAKTNALIVPMLPSCLMRSGTLGVFDWRHDEAARSALMPNVFQSLDLHPT